MSTDTERAAFEAWALKEYGKHAANRYASVARCEWAAWQAARAAAPAVAEQEPVLWQSRMRASWQRENEWTPWRDVSAAQGRELAVVVIPDWTYEVRALYLAAPSTQKVGAAQEPAALSDYLRIADAIDPLTRKKPVDNLTLAVAAKLLRAAPQDASKAPAADLYGVCMLVAEAAFKQGCGRDRALPSDMLRAIVREVIGLAAAPPAADTVQQAPEGAAQDLAALDPNESDPIVLWTAIAKLQAAIQGPAGFASWQDAAVHERHLRVQAERRAAPQDASKAPAAACNVPPAGWNCTRVAGHAGPCAASPAAPPGMTAVAWVQKRLDDFIKEHGATDPDTGAVEFGRGAHAQAKEEYAGELTEIIEGLQALAAAPPAADTVQQAPDNVKVSR